MIVRASKFRHVYGNPAKKESCFEGLRVSKTGIDSNLCSVNPYFLAVVLESSGGGVFTVLPVNKVGRVDPNLSKVSGHRAPITDLKFNPHHDFCIASASEDATIKIWQIPENGLHLDLIKWCSELVGHSKKILYIEWHPIAEWALLSAAADNLCIVWNILDGSSLKKVDVHGEMIQSISWSYDGKCFATTSKDKIIRLIDARKGTVVSKGSGHEGTKVSKIVCLAIKDRLFTTGFSRTGEREYALWDSNDLSKPLKIENIDSSNGVIIPFADNDLNIIYLAGKGDGNIRYVEILSTQPYVYFLNQYQSATPQRSLGFMPKRGLDVKKCEVARFYKIHVVKDLCEPIAMICPRKADCFQADIYPPTRGSRPALTAKDWFSGANTGFAYIDLQYYCLSDEKSNLQNLDHIFKSNKVGCGGEATPVVKHDVNENNLVNKYQSSSTIDSDDEYFSPTMIDRISTEAPDNTLIKPSCLRATMDSRQRNNSPSIARSVPSRTGSLRSKFEYVSGNKSQPSDYQSPATKRISLPGYQTAKNGIDNGHSGSAIKKIDGCVTMNGKSTINGNGDKLEYLLKRNEMLEKESAQQKLELEDFRKILNKKDEQIKHLEKELTRLKISHRLGK